jgi:O-antigen/teichoic acid export membrane protein
MLKRRQLVTDWTANLASFLLLAVSGALINAVIAKEYGTSALGVFNQIFAVYIFGSQLATLGCQFSVLRYVADYYQEPARCHVIIRAALFIALLASLLVWLLLSLFFAAIGPSLYSRAVADCAPFMMPGLVAFALNKVLLNALNGARRITLYAFFTGLRYVLMGTIALTLVALAAPSRVLSLILSLSDALLLLPLALCCWFIFPRCGVRTDENWIRRHIHFGVRSILGGIAVEVNTRIDVLILGIFSTDTAVGIYSFAAFFVEGLLQLPLLARRIVDPILTSLVTRRDHQALALLLMRGRNINGALVVVMNLLAFVFYPWYARLFGTAQLASESWNLFSILLMGSTLFGIYAMFSGIFSQGGLPLVQTRFNVLFLAVNLLVNLCLVPFYGALGAAIATSLSFAAGALILRNSIYRHFTIRI